MNTSTINLQLHIDNIIKYLQPYKLLINCHMVNFLTDNLWTTLIPSDIQSQITNKSDIENAIEQFWKTSTNNDKDDINNIQSVKSFVRNSEKYRMDNLTDVWMSPNDLTKQLSNFGCSLAIEHQHKLSVKEFMSEKKNHEVEITAHLIAHLCTYGVTENKPERLSVIDAGDGKGYLSSRLALEYDLRVLGVDANETNSENALKRQSKLERAWTSLTKRAQDIKNGQKPPARKGGKRKFSQNKKLQIDKINVNRKYQTATQFITSDTNFCQLFESYFNGNNETVGQHCITGLHTCGNLASTCLKVFVKNDCFAGLCNVGCCYHLLSEEFKSDDFFVNRRSPTNENDPIEFGFPMSEHLRNQEFDLGRNARMLACQSLSRSVAKSELPSSTLFYRALLEVLIVKQNSELKNCIQVGRMKNCNTFEDYYRMCNERVNLNIDTDTYEMITLCKSFAYEGELLKLFYLIRMTFAPILETLILLDRLLYLKENRLERSFLVKLFDPVISPRCYGIIALKEL